MPLRQKHLLFTSRNQFRRVCSKSSLPASTPTPASDSYYDPRNKGDHPLEMSTSCLPLFVTEYGQMSHSIQLHKGSSRPLPVANLFSITSEVQRVKLTRHSESARRRQSEATSNNHSCIVVNKKLGKLCPPGVSSHTEK